jgi:hypothetical protein
MTELEYDVLDELYFLADFKSLVDELQVSPQVLILELYMLIEKGWVKVLENELEVEVGNLDLFNKKYTNYNYLATKAGLLAHNSR